MCTLRTNSGSTGLEASAAAYHEGLLAYVWQRFCQKVYRACKLSWYLFPNNYNLSYGNGPSGSAFLWRPSCCSSYGSIRLNPYCYKPTLTDAFIKRAFLQSSALYAGPKDHGHDNIVVPAREDRLRQASR